MSFEEKVLRAAFDYIGRGWRVHPLRPGTKVPILPDWVNEASADAEQVASWFGPGGEYVGFNIGIVTGAASDLWVVDIDTGHGAAAQASLDALTEHHKPLRATYTVETPSGGTHLYYRYPKLAPDESGEVPTWGNVNAGEGSRHHPLGLGIDTRGEGGQVAAWPSRINEQEGRTYRRTIRNEPAEPQRWLALKARDRVVKMAEVQVDVGELSAGATDAANRYVTRAVTDIVAELDALGAARTDDPKKYRGPYWNDTVFRKACRLLEFANASWAPISEGDAHALLMEHAPRDKKFTDRTVATIWSSAHRKVGGEAARLPTGVIGPYVFDAQSPARRPREGSELPPGPDAFVTRADGLLPAQVAAWVARGDLAEGADRQWWVYEAGVWRPDADVVVRRASRLLGDKWRHAFAPTIEDKVRDAEGLYHLADTINHDLVNLRNGMLDWASGTLSPHDPSYLSTVQLQSEWRLDAECPRFDAWLDELAPEGVRQRIWEVMGYMLLPGNRLQRAVLLWGEGRNGKGTLTRVLRRIIGRWNISSVTLRSISEGKFEVAEMYGKQANIAADIEARYLRETAMFKTITGEDLVNAQRKHQRPFDFVCHATPLFSANQLWRSDDNSEGYHRRWVHVPMNRKVDEGAPFDEEALFAEMDGITRKAIEAVRGVMATGKFTESAETTMLSEDFRQQSDLVQIWRRNDETLVLDEPGVEKGDTWMRRQDVYLRFKQWAEESGHGTMSSTRFYQHLGRLGFGESRRQGGRGYYGFRFLPRFSVPTQ